MEHRGESYSENIPSGSSEAVSTEVPVDLSEQAPHFEPPLDDAHLAAHAICRQLMGGKKPAEVAKEQRIPPAHVGVAVLMIRSVLQGNPGQDYPLAAWLAKQAGQPPPVLSAKPVSAAKAEATTKNRKSTRRTASMSIRARGDEKLVDAAGGTETQKDSTTGYVYDDNLDQYLSQVGKVNLLSDEDEAELSRRIEAGLFAEQLLHEGRTIDKATPGELRALARQGEEAYDDFLQANLPMVISYAKKKSTTGTPSLDDIQVGNIGLLEALEKFDYRKGYRFSTYAFWWVKQAIDRASEDSQVPRDHRQGIAKMLEARWQYLNETRRAPSLATLAQRLDCTPQKIRQLEESMQYLYPLSLDAPIDEDGKTVFGDTLVRDDVITPGTPATAEAGHLSINPTLLDILSDELRQVISLSVGLEDDSPKTLDEIAKRLGKKPSAIKDRLRLARNMLRHPSSDLGRLIGIDWHLEAACQSIETKRFFGMQSSNNQEVQAACAQCPVKAQCLDSGAEIESVGGSIWGGVYINNRETLLSKIRKLGGTIEKEQSFAKVLSLYLELSAQTTPQSDES